MVEKTGAITTRETGPTAKIEGRAASVLFGTVRQMLASGEIDAHKFTSVMSELAMDLSDVGNPRQGTEYFVQQSGEAEDVMDYINRSVGLRK